MSVTLSLAAARGSMKLIAGTDYAQLLPMMSVTQEDYERVTGEKAWVAVERERVRRTLDNLGAALMDVLGVPRFEMPAEYIAAVVVTFVSPTNIHTACRWMEGMRAAEALAGATTTPADVSPSQVFALCTYLLDDKSQGIAQVRSAFEKKVGLAVKRSAKEIADG